MRKLRSILAVGILAGALSVGAGVPAASACVGPNCPCEKEPLLTINGAWRTATGRGDLIPCK